MSFGVAVVIQVESQLVVGCINVFIGIVSVHGEVLVLVVRDGHLCVGISVDGPNVLVYIVDSLVLGNQGVRSLCQAESRDSRDSIVGIV